MKRLVCLLGGLLSVLALYGANPAYTDFLSQFTTNGLKIALTNGLTVTNLDSKVTLNLNGVPILANSFTTNNPGKTDVIVPTSASGLTPLTHINLDGTLYESSAVTYTGTNSAFRGNATANAGVFTNGLQLKASPAAGFMMIGDASGNAAWGTNVSQGNFTNLSVNGVPVSGGGMGGSGTSNNLAKWTGTNTLGDSAVTDDGTTLLFGTAGNFAFDLASGHVGFGTTSLNPDAGITFSLVGNAPYGVLALNNSAGPYIRAARQSPNVDRIILGLDDETGGTHTTQRITTGTGSSDGYSLEIFPDDGADGAGGSLTLQSGNGTGAGDTDGGDVTITAGEPANNGSGGHVFINGGTGGTVAIDSGGSGGGLVIDDAFNIFPNTDSVVSLGTTSLRWAEVNSINGTFGNILAANDLVATNSFKFASAAAAGYVLTSDASGNATWQPATGDVTNTYNTIIATNLTVIQTNSFNIGKGGHLTLTNSLTVLPLSNTVLSVTSAGLVTNTTIGTGLAYDTSTRTLSSTVTAGSTPGFTIATNYYVTLNQTNIDNGAAGTNAFLIVGGSGSGVTNGNNLLAAYTAAKGKTPNGAALAVANRFTIFLAPGLYDLGSQTLTMDTDFIDVIGLDPNTGDLVYPAGSRNYGDTLITSSGTVVNITSSGDVVLMNVALRNTGASGYCLGAASNFGSATKIINVYMGIEGTGSPRYVSKPSVTYDGYWQDVRAWRSKFATTDGSSMTLSGTFIRCKAAGQSFGGAFSDQNMTLSGTFIDCEAEGNSFGSAGTGTHTLSGKFVRVRWVASVGEGSGQGILGDGDSCTATLSGTFTDCSSVGSTSTSSFGDSVTGTLINCSMDAGWTGAPGSGGVLRNFSTGARVLNTAGTGTQTFKVGGNAKTIIVQVGVVGSGEDTLMTNTVPANTLSSNGDYLEFRASGDYAANGNNKTVKAYFGTNLIFNSTALAANGGFWVMTGQIVRSNATTQLANVSWTSSNALLPSTATNSTAIATLSSASSVYLTGEATSDNDIVQRSLTLKWFPAN